MYVTFVGDVFYVKSNIVYKLCKDKLCKDIVYTITPLVKTVLQISAALCKPSPVGEGGSLKADG